MDITPAIKMACIGGLGYLFGVVAKTNPKMTALTWLIAETAIQLFQQLDSFRANQLEYPSRIIVGGIACIYLSEQHLLTKIVHTVISMAVFSLMPDILRRLNLKKIEIAFS